MLVLSGYLFLSGGIDVHAVESKKMMPCGVQPDRFLGYDGSNKLQEHQQNVRLKDDAYEFLLKNGKVKQFKVAIEDGGEGAKYYLVDYLKIPGFFVLGESYLASEGSSHFILLDDRLGVKIEIDGIPLFAGECTRFIALDVCDFECSGRLAIWEKQGDFWKEVWAFAPYEHWINGQARWINNNEVQITKEVYLDPGQPNSGTVKRTFNVRLVKEGWKVYEVPANTKP